MITVDLNADVGESFGRYTLGLDQEIMPVISSANIACGFHASDPMVMEKTVQMAAEAGTAIGAHPGYPDLMGFGRRNMTVSPDEARAYVLYQLGAPEAFLRPRGIRMAHVKPHGALYNMAAKDPALAEGICGAIRDFDPELKLVGLSGSVMIQTAETMGLRAVAEVFADRAYEEDGSLVSRGKPGAVLTDAEIVIPRVIRMVKEEKVTAVNGKDIPIRADSICVHGDGEKAVAFAKGIRKALEREGIRVQAP